MKKTVVELFAGVGGFRVGLNNITGIADNGLAIENRKWEFVWANQWEPSTTTQHAYECYVQRFGLSENHSNVDISLVDKKNIPVHSLLVGGFPCQDYSVARTLSGEKGIEGKKGVLFWEIAEILKVKNSPFVLLENVDRLLKSPARQRGRDFGIMLRTFYELGYNVEWRVINAADYGCAQKRRRVYIFAWKSKTKYNKAISKSDSISLLQKKGLFAKSCPINMEETSINKIRCVDISTFSDSVEMSESFKFEFDNCGVLVNNLVTTQKIVPAYETPITLKEIRLNDEDLSIFLLNEIQISKFEYLKGGKRVLRQKPNGEDYFYSEGSMSFPDSLDGPGRTMLTSESTLNRSTHVIEDAKTGKLRLITPIEAERLQSFPDNWTNSGMPDKKRYFMMGNALVTKIISRIEVVLSDIIENE